MSKHVLKLLKHPDKCQNRVRKIKTIYSIYYAHIFFCLVKLKKETKNFCLMNTINKMLSPDSFC